MRYNDVERIIADIVDRLVEVGVSREAAERGAKECEGIAILDLIETAADQRFLDMFRDYGSAVIAERKGVCQRTVMRQRNEAAERIARKKIGRAMSDPLAAA